MKCTLFCENPYAFGVLAPIRDVLRTTKDFFIWYISPKLLDTFPFKNEDFTTSILDIHYFKSDVIFVPGNAVPHYLRGLKVQVFHGLAGEKGGHFRIRHYFDLYLTQGPYFTERFKKLAQKHQNFGVIETGWPKLDVFSTDNDKYNPEKRALLEAYRTDKIILYAPTFSPSLTSAPYLLEEIKILAVKTEYLICIKFHDLMDPIWMDAYKKLAHEIPNILIIKENNISKWLLIADVLVSDTSSVIYEFLLLDKPVISFHNISDKLFWDDSKSYSNLTEKVRSNLKNDQYAKERAHLNSQIHPYKDGKSAERMVTTAKNYIAEYGVPEYRELSVARKLKIFSIFGRPVANPYNGFKNNKISAILITYNEILHIEAVLENIKFADEIIIVDSYSMDGTVEKIKEYPHVQLIQRPFKNFTDQKTFALTQATNDWVLFLDADERVPDPLKNEILETVNSDGPTASAYFFFRTFMFKNKVLRFSGWQTDKNYRLFKKSKVAFTQDRIVHETLIVQGNSSALKHKLIHYSYREYQDYKGKMIKYGQLKALEEFNKGTKWSPMQQLLRPIWKFFNHYIIRRGILDGNKGFIICYLNALGVYARYKELKRLDDKLIKSYPNHIM